MAEAEDRRFYYTTGEEGGQKVLYISGVFRKNFGEDAKAKILALWRDIQDEIDTKFEIEIYVEIPQKGDAKITFLPVVSTFPKRYYEETREMGSENILSREITREEYLKGKKSSENKQYRTTYVLDKATMAFDVQKAMFTLVDSILLHYPSL
ncbi:MAG: hypothetical protein Q4A30_00275 [Candidatus Saccharibacteria bacterium]|nr:hypothetical protein [Candidatus Saccharibacteria bacterium]